jgi:hypothetical protein
MIRTFTRASVWIEQEVAILAAIAQAQSREVKIQLYVKRGVAREGLRVFVMANPYEFDTEEEVVTHFRSLLPTWNLTLGPRALTATAERLLSLCADTGEIKIQASDQRGSFVRIPGCDFVDPTDRAVAARFVQAVEALREQGLVRQIAPNSFELTASGFDRARALPRDLSWLELQPVAQIDVATAASRRTWTAPLIPEKHRYARSVGGSCDGAVSTRVCAS